MILQPYLNVFVPYAVGEGLVVRPYLALFNSSDLGEGDSMRGMSDAMLGAFSTWRSVDLDARYALYDMSQATRVARHELGLRASADVLSLGERPPPWSGGFSLRPFAGVYGGTADGAADLYLETGLEPSWRCRLAGRKVGVALPLIWGLSGDNYYFDDSGNNSALGYLSAAVTASVSLPIPERRGEWFLNVSLQYLHLFADNLAAINRGDRDPFAAKVGVGFSY